MGQEIGIITIKPIEKKPIILEELCNHLELQRGQSNFGVCIYKSRWNFYSLS